MANMSYCRFHNTYGDTVDCIDALENGDALSSDEYIACKNMFENILEYFEREDVIEVDWDEFNYWLDRLERK